jgi:hypothetical protein
VNDDWGPFMNKAVPRRIIRMIRPRPFLHEPVPVPMWSTLIMVAIVLGSFAQGTWFDRLMGVVSWGIMIAAVIQWLWWGRRGRARD